MRTSIRRRILYIYLIDLVATGVLYAALTAFGPGITTRMLNTAEDAAAGVLDTAARALLRSVIDTLAPKTVLAEECFQDADSPKALKYR